MKLIRIAFLFSPLLLSACDTTPTIGTSGARTIATGSTAGAAGQGTNSQIERCAQTLGTMAVVKKRSGIQLTAAEGSAQNCDFDMFGVFFHHELAGAIHFSNTAQGKVLAASFMDSYNHAEGGAPLPSAIGGGQTG
jgi:hypothetical protein